MLSIERPSDAQEAAARRENRQSGHTWTLSGRGPCMPSPRAGGAMVLPCSPTPRARIHTHTVIFSCMDSLLPEPRHHGTCVELLGVPPLRSPLGQGFLAVTFGAASLSPRIRGLGGRLERGGQQCGQGVHLCHCLYPGPWLSMPMHMFPARNVAWGQPRHVASHITLSLSCTLAGKAVVYVSGDK